MRESFAQFERELFGNRQLQEHVRDAVYVAVGIGVMAYSFSAPYRQRACQTAERFFEGTQADRSRQ